MIKKYATATAFRKALEERLKNHAHKIGVDLQRLRRQVAFDRLLFRLFQFFRKDLLLKGGYAMELRFEHGRTTKDIDLILQTSRTEGSNNPEQTIRQMLQEAVQKDSGDFFSFLVGEPTLDLEAVPYGGARYPIEALLDGRLFVRFPIDVVISSLFLEPIEQIESEDWLGFAGIEKMPFPTISKEQQFAEKLHAYTLPREKSENSRVKDLIDLTLLIEVGRLKKDFLEKVIGKVFEYRNTHPAPDGLMEPPKTWGSPFDQLKSECGLDLNLEAALGKMATYLNLLIYVNEEKMLSAPSISKCHFCEDEASVWLSDVDILDANCETCGFYRITGFFVDNNNSKINHENWKAWAHYLRNRTPENKKRRIKISTDNFLPPKYVTPPNSSPPPQSFHP